MFLLAELVSVVFVCQSDLFIQGICEFTKNDKIGVGLGRRGRAFVFAWGGISHVVVETDKISGFLRRGGCFDWWCCWLWWR